MKDRIKIFYQRFKARRRLRKLEQNMPVIFDPAYSLQIDRELDRLDGGNDDNN